MKKTPLFLLLAVLVAVSSCKKSPPPATTISVTVTNGASGSVSGGATVNLYETAAGVSGGSAKYSQVTDASGKTKFTVAYLAKYFIIVKNNGAANYYNGYIPVGIFTSQTDINDSPAQSPAAVVGGARYQDTNGDGVINSSDFVTVPSIDVTQNANTNFSVVIY